MYVLREKMQKSLSVFLALLLMVSMTACANEKESESIYPTDIQYEDEILTEPETEPPVQVEMPDYELTYSGEMRDLIVVKRLEEQNALDFFVKLSEGEYRIFTLLYNSEEGELVTVLNDAEGNRVPVAFVMESIPDNLSEDDELTFCVAQEAVNDIVESLVIK